MSSPLAKRFLAAAAATNQGNSNRSLRGTDDTAPTTIGVPMNHNAHSNISNGTSSFSFNNNHTNSNRSMRGPKEDPPVSILSMHSATTTAAPSTSSIPVNRRFGAARSFSSQSQSDNTALKDRTATTSNDEPNGSSNASVSSTAPMTDRAPSEPQTPPPQPLPTYGRAGGRATSSGVSSVRSQGSTSSYRSMEAPPEAPPVVSSSPTLGSSSSTTGSLNGGKKSPSVSRSNSVTSAKTITSIADVTIATQDSKKLTKSRSFKKKKPLLGGQDDDNNQDTKMSSSSPKVDKDGKKIKVAAPRSPPRNRAMLSMSNVFSSPSNRNGVTRSPLDRSRSSPDGRSNQQQLPGRGGFAGSRGVSPQLRPPPLSGDAAAATTTAKNDKQPKVGKNGTKTNGVVTTSSMENNNDGNCSSPRPTKGALSGDAAAEPASPSNRSLPPSIKDRLPPEDISYLPHTPAELSEAQRLDPVLRQYIRTTTKGFFVKAVDGYPVVFFHGKIFVPASLREATIRYYIATVEDAIRQNCIWPDLSDHVHNFLNQNLIGGLYGGLGDDTDPAAAAGAVVSTPTRRVDETSTGSCSSITHNGTGTGTDTGSDDDEEDTTDDDPLDDYDSEVSYDASQSRIFEQSDPENDSGSIYLVEIEDDSSEEEEREQRRRQQRRQMQTPPAPPQPTTERKSKKKTKNGVLGAKANGASHDKKTKKKKNSSDGKSPASHREKKRAGKKTNHVAAKKQDASGTPANSRKTDTASTDEDSKKMPAVNNSAAFSSKKTRKKGAIEEL